MEELPEPLVFEWDAGNSNKNFIKHNVINKEAEEIFKNELSIMFEDKKHSLNEDRYLLWGITNKGRKLAVYFTLRGNKIRVISARDMNRKERRAYEEKIKDNS